MADTLTLEAVEILRPGTYIDAHGRQVTVSKADMVELAAAYDPALRDAPAVVGHPRMDDPAYGWMRNLRVEGEVLLCDLDGVDPDFADSLQTGRYKHRSLSFYRPASRGNPKPGSHYPKHLGLLGARAPAVPGLKPIAFGEGDDDAVIIDLCATDWRMPWALRSIATGFGRFRDWLIQEKGLDEADKILPAYVAEDLRSTAAGIEAEVQAEARAEPATNFSTPDNGGPMGTQEDLAAREAALSQREATLAAREQGIKNKEVALAAAEDAARTKDDAAFVDALIAEGRLAPGEKDSVLAELAAMDDGAAVIELAADEGETVKLTPHQAYRSRLSKASKLVEHGEFDKGKRDPGAVDFAAPDGYTVSPVGCTRAGQRLDRRRFGGWRRGGQGGIVRQVSSTGRRRV